MNSSSSSSRFFELDCWRGLAVIGMIIFHIAFFANYFHLLEIRYFEGGWLLLARLVQFTFLLLVGIGMQLSFQKSAFRGDSFQGFLKKEYRKAALLFACALMITIASFFLAPDDAIVFGILHFIAASLFLLSPLARFPILSGLLASIAFLLSFPISGIQTSSLPLIVIGFSSPTFRSLDYFPLFPWLSIPLMGIFLGSLLYPQGQRRYHFPGGFFENASVPRFFALLGRHSLLIYLTHGPIVIALIYFLHHLSL